MSSQANRLEEFLRNDPTYRKLKDEINEIRSEIIKLIRSLKPNDPLQKFIPLLYKFSHNGTKYSIYLFQKIAKGLNEMIDQNQKDVKELQDIIKNLQATIEAAQAMTDLSSASDSRKRPRTLLKL